MSSLHFSHKTVPENSEEFQRLLRQALASSHPIDDLLELAAELRAFESQYGMASDEFFEKFNAGQIGDDIDFFDWNASYRMYVSLRRSIETALIRAALVNIPQLTNSEDTGPVNVSQEIQAA